jgi:hypothetical protein
MPFNLQYLQATVTLHPETCVEVAFKNTKNRLHDHKKIEVVPANQIKPLSRRIELNMVVGGYEKLN